MQLSQQNKEMLIGRNFGPGRASFMELLGDLKDLSDPWWF
jgi:hypothetical protein